MALRIISETFGTKKIEDAFREAFEPYFRDFEIPMVTEKESNKEVESSSK